MMTVMRVTISRRDTADTTITDDLLHTLHVSTFSINVGNSCVPGIDIMMYDINHDEYLEKKLID